MKRLAKDAAIYGLSSIVGRFLNWMLVPVYTRVLAGAGEFGVYTNLYAWVALLLILLTYGMETGFFRFINKKEESAPLRVYATTLFSLGLTSGLFLLCTLCSLGPLSRALNYARHPEYLAMMLGVAAVDAFCCIPFAYLRYKGRPLRFMAIKLLGISLNIGLNLFFLIACPYLHQRAPQTVGWFYIPGYALGYAFIANAIASAVTLAALIPDMLPGFRHAPDFALLKRMLRYSFPMLILGIAGILNQTADKILFPWLFDDKAYANEQLGIYGACFKIAVAMAMFIQAFRYAYEPYVFEKNRGGGAGSRREYAEAMKYFIIFGLFIFLGIVFYLDILKYFVAPAYYPGLRVVPVVMLGELFFGIYFNLSFWYKLSDQTRWGAYFSVAGCVVTLSIILLFAPAYGYMACAWASFICNLLMALLSYLVGQKKFPVSYDLKSAFTYSALTIIFYSAGMFPVIESESLRLLYRTLLLIVFLLLIIKRDFPFKRGNRPQVGDDPRHDSVH